MTATPLPPPDTHCFDDDTQMDVWSYSAPLVEQIVKQALTALATIESDHFTSADMADAQVKAFRAGVASVTAGQEPVADINVRPSESGGTIASVFSHKLPVGSWLVYAAPVVQQPQKLEDIEQYRMQMAGISTAAIGYWKEGDSIHPDYDTLALRDVAKLYAKYDALHKAQQPQAEPVPQDVGQLEYRGNSVAYIHQKMTAYRGAIDAAWQAMRDAGHPPDGCTPLAHAITKALTPQQAEAVPSDVVRDADVEAAAKKMAEIFDYPWDFMPEKGRNTMRENVREVLIAAQGTKT